MTGHFRKKYTSERNHYIRTIQKSLPIRSKYRKHLMKNLKQSIINYEETHAACTIEELYQEFGTPQELCESILQTTPPEQILENMAWKRNITGILLCIAILAFIFIVYREIQIYLFAPAEIEIYIGPSPSATP